MRPTYSELLDKLAALEAANEFLQSILDGVAEPIMVIGTDFHIKLMNRAAREFAAPGSDDSAETWLCYEISHRRSAPCNGREHPCPLTQVLESGQPVTLVHTHFQADGERRFVEVAASPWVNKQGDILGIIESNRDITEHQLAKDALQEHAERLLALSAQLAEVSDLERQRLSRELHDQVGQNLTALEINLRIVQMQLPPDTPAPVCARLQDSLSLVSQTNERIRDVMANLRPPVLDDYGLVATLHWYREQFQERTGIVTALTAEELAIRLPARVENALFRIVQEALTNVAKHARASFVAITLFLAGGILRLTIEDDGIGFDPAETAAAGGRKGWGLLTMSERAEALGARWSVESQPGDGTCITVEVPL